MCRTFGQLLVEAGNGGSIINISSIAGKALPAGAAAYSASKAGLQALTACMAQEVGAAGVRVNAICPGYIETSRMDDLKETGRHDRVIARDIPLGRAGTGEDVAACAVYLCSDQGAWVTGQSWNVDGGNVVAH